MKPEFDESTIRALAADPSFYRGQDYFEGGLVRSLVLEGETYKARVHGTRRYVVRVWEEEGTIETSCTCPYDWGGICKHVVAVMLAILARQEQGGGFRQVSGPPARADIPVDELLESLPADQLRAFVRRQVAEVPQMAENLRIFAQGPRETGRTVEQYEAEIVAALEEGEYADPYEEEYYYYGRDRGFDEEEGGDTVEEILQPFLDAARRYQEQENWIENSKIQEAVARACARMIEEETFEEEGDAFDEEEDDGSLDEEEEGYEGVPEFARDACHSQAEEALKRWGEALGKAAPPEEKARWMARLCAFFVRPPCDFDHLVWEEVFRAAVTRPEEAKEALERLEKQQGKGLKQDPEKAGVLVHLLDLSGDMERFLEVGKKAARHLPHLALAVGEKLVGLGRKAEAVEVAEKALSRTRRDPYFFDHDTRLSLLRFLVQTYDRRRQYEKLVERAQEVFFATQAFGDYLTARDLLRTAKEREAWIQEVEKKASAAALIEILPAENRWEQLLKSARKHRRDAEFPRMIERLQERFPEECFALYRQVLLEVAEEGADRHVYRQVADHARQLQKIPGQEEAFGELMAELVEKYSRRSALMRELGELAELGRKWRASARKARFEKVTPAQLRKMGIDELIELCPVGGEEDMEKLRRKRSTGQRSSAALVWAILIKNGGKMKAAEISKAIAAQRGGRLQSAASQRSNGLRMLEALGYVEVERKGKRLGAVRMLAATG